MILIKCSYDRLIQLNRLKSIALELRTTVPYCPVFMISGLMCTIKPDSHRKIVQDYRSKTGKDQGILSESG